MLHIKLLIMSRSLHIYTLRTNYTYELVDFGVFPVKKKKNDTPHHYSEKSERLLGRDKKS